MPHDLLTDTTIAARYRIDRMLGSGGMARVYAAHDELLGRPVAVRVLRDRFASDAAFAERFRREARSAASLHHPNIVQVFDCAPEDAGPAYIVMELIDGPSLRDLLDTTGPLPEARAASLVMQAARGLGHAHAHGVVHRDVKPENMLLDAHGTLRVADFGIARLIDSGDTLTEVGSVVGTARYLSPEQARGERVTPASDVYALGVVLYELLTGRTPFAGDNAIEVALLQVQSEPVPPGELRPGLTPRLEAIVLRALCKEPGERFATATELADALAGDSSTATTEVLAGVAPTVRMASGVEPTAVKTVLAGQPRARPTWQRALVVAVALIGLALAGAYLVRGDTTKRASAARTTPPAAGAAAPAPTATPQLTAVPALVGMPLEQARAASEAAGFELVVASAAASESVARDSIVSQSPEGGGQIAPGSSITVVVSSGTPVPAGKPREDKHVGKGHAKHKGGKR